MSIEQEAADLLERAADGYESGRYYWTRGRYSNMVFGHQAYCSLGALGHEAGLTCSQLTESTFDNTPVLAQAVLALASVVEGPEPFYPAGVVVTWNDGLEMDEKFRLVARGKGPVIEAMKQAAKDLRNATGDNV